MPRRSSRTPADRGFTLVELMIGVAVSTLIVVATLALFTTITAAQRRQQASRHAEARQALEVMQRDLACAVAAACTNRPAFRLEARTMLDGTTASDLSITTTRLDDGDMNLAHLEVWSVRYHLVAEAPGTDLTLTREAVRVQALDSGGVIATSILFRSATGFGVGVPSGNQWTNQWTPTARQPLPPVVRMELAWPQDGTTAVAEAWTVLPAALRFPGPAAARRRSPAPGQGDRSPAVPTPPGG